MITTNDFELSKKDYYGLLLKQYLKQRWWLLAVPVLCLFLGKMDIIVVSCVVIGAVAAYVLLYYWDYVNQLAKGLFMARRHMEFDDQFISTYFVDGSMSKIKLDHIRRIVTGKKHFVIYDTSSQFHLLPKAAFISENDQEKFEQYIIKHGLRK